MSMSVDERVVRMEFQNGQFEKAAKESMQTLQQLNSNLKFDGAAKGFKDLEVAATNCDLSSIASAVEDLSNRFSTLGVMGMTVLQNLTNQAVEAGKRMLASVTTDQISAGWQKYESQTSSVQTLMNATGKSMEEIQGYLDKLMWFSDETSYGFADMTSALAQMTTTGGDIEKLIPLIMGMANATSFAGKSNNEFQRSIYNLAQSYGTGHLQLMDWKSLDLAGTSSVQLKESLIKAAEEMGVIEKGAVNVSNFAETLSDKWATKEVMEKGFGYFAEMSELAYQMVQDGTVDTATEAYEILGEKYDTVSLRAARAAQEAKTFGEALAATQDAVSTGWMKTFDIIFGNYVEAKELWSGLAETLWELFASGAHERNAMLEEWKELGGRDSAINSVKNLFEGLMSVLRPIQEAFRKVFAAMDAPTLYRLTKQFEYFTRTLHLTEQGEKNLSTAFEAFFRVIKVFTSLIGAAAKIVGKLLTLLNPIVTVLLYIAGAIGTIVNAIFGVFSSVENLYAAIADIKNFFSTLYKVFNNAGSTLDGVMQVIFTILSESIWSGFDFIMEVTGKNLNEYRDYFYKGFLDISNKIYSGIKVIQNAFKTGDWSAVFQPLYDLNSGIKDWFNEIQVSYIEGGEGLAGVVEVIFDQLAFAFQKAVNLVSRVTGKSYDELKETWTKKIFELRNTVVDAIYEFQNKVTSFDWEALGLQPVVDFLSKTLESIKGIASELKKTIGGFFESLNPLPKISQAFSEASENFSGFGIDFDKAIKIIDTGIFGAIVFALVKLLKFITDEVHKFLANYKNVIVAFEDLFGALQETLESFQKAIKAKIIKDIAGAVVALVAALVVLTFVDQEKLLGALGAITLVFAELMGSLLGVTFAMKKLKLTELEKTGKTLIEFSVAVLILASAVKTLAKLDVDKLTAGMVAISALVAEMAGVTYLMGKMQYDFPKGASALLILAASIKILTKSVEKLAKIDEEKLVKGLEAVLAIILELAIFMKVADFERMGEASKTSFVALALAITILAHAVKVMGELDPDAALQGVEAVGIILSELAIFSRTSKQIDGTTFIPLSLGMMVLAGVVAILGNMNPEKALFGVETLGVILFELAIALRSIPEDAPKIAAGILILSGALAILVADLTALALLSNFEGAVLKALGIIAVLLTEMGLFMVAMDKFIGSSPTEVATSFLVIAAALTILVAALIALSIIPFPIIIIGLIEMAAALGILIGAAALAQLVGYGLVILSESIKDIGVGMLAISASTLIFAAALNLLLLFAVGAGAALGTLVTVIVEVIKAIAVGLANGIVGFLQALSALAGPIKEALGTLFDTLLQFLSEKLGTTKEFLQNALDMVIAFLTLNFPKFVEAGLGLLMSLLEGIWDNIKEITAVAVGIISEFINGLSENIGELIDAGINFMVQFIDGLATGIEENSTAVIDAILHLGSAIIDGLIEGLGAGVTFVVDKIKEIAGRMVDAIKEFLGIHSPSTVFADIGGNIIQGLIDGISGLMDKAITLIQGLADKLTGLFKKEDESEESGEGNMSAMIGGYENEEANAVNMAKQITEKVIGTIRSYEPKFLDAGKNAIASLIQGYKNKEAELLSTLRSMMQRAASAIQSERSKWEQAAEYLIDGFVQGIKDNTWMAERAAEIMARRALAAAEAEFEVASPSKKFWKIGQYVVMGLANGISDNEHLSTLAAQEMGESAYDEMAKSIRNMGDLMSQEFDNAPVIRPVIDLDDVRKGAGEISSLLSNANAIDVSGIELNVRKAAATMQEVTPTGGETTSTTSQTYNFTQNNYSPKSLSRLDIYRQTRNQFSAFKEEMDRP